MPRDVGCWSVALNILSVCHWRTGIDSMLRHSYSCVYAPGCNIRRSPQLQNWQISLGRLPSDGCLIDISPLRGTRSRSQDSGLQMMQEVQSEMANTALVSDPL